MFEKVPTRLGHYLVLSAGPLHEVEKKSSNNEGSFSNNQGRESVRTELF